MAAELPENTSSSFSTSQLESLFWHVCANGPVAAVQKLILVHGLSVDRLNKYGETPLIVAVRSGATDVVRALLKHRPRLSGQLVEGKTCVEWAKGTQLYQVFQMEAMQLMTTEDLPRLKEMLEAGLDANDETDLSPLHWAKTVGTDKVVELLQLQCPMATGQASPNTTEPKRGTSRQSGQACQGNASGGQKGSFDSLELFFPASPHRVLILHLVGDSASF
eukprot:INCI4257.1.p1 GENE.INCI4257.1~~INCI4257.1.p1  ORF type:complete len:220 (-),score=35.42 INCI4257.1:267-926(-)